VDYGERAQGIKRILQLNVKTNLRKELENCELRGAGGGILAFLRFEPATSGLKAFAPFVLQIMSLAP
jgi:hypothetical protein